MNLVSKAKKALERVGVVPTVPPDSGRAGIAPRCPQNADAIDEEFNYRARLHDSRLLARSQRVEIAEGIFDLCVPVGGKRRGGCVLCATEELAEKVIEQLQNWPGIFPNLRMRHSDLWTVWWSFEEPPADQTDHRKMGRFFGYSEKAISKFIRDRGNSTELLEGLEAHRLDFTHAAVLIRVGNSTIAVFAEQHDRVEALNHAISRGGAAPVGFVGVDVDAETISVYTRSLGPAADTDWDIKLFARWSDLQKARQSRLLLRM